MFARTPTTLPVPTPATKQTTVMLLLVQPIVNYQVMALSQVI